MVLESNTFFYLIMLRFIFSVVLVSAFTFLRLGNAWAASVEGTHPYDRATRIQSSGSASRNSSTWGYRSLLDYERSPYRTTTHMLHPYFRKNPGKMYLARDIRRIHPRIVQQDWERYQSGGWAF